jgi:hypothetical protein
VALVQREIKASLVLLERLEHRACPELWVVQELLVHLELPAHPARLVDLELQVALVLLVFLAQLEHLVFQARPEPLEHLEYKVLKDFKVPLVQAVYPELPVCLEVLVPRVRLVRKVFLVLKVLWD